jgi:hypothetical protein
LAWIALALSLVGVPNAALAQQERAVWQPGPGGVGDNTYLGYIEQPPFGNIDSGTPFVISGWLIDKSAQGWAGFDQVQIYTGPMGAGGSQLASATVGLDRPDVAESLGNPYWNAAGFSADLPASAFQPGVSPVLVYGHTPSKGWWYTTIYLSINESGAAASSGGPPTVSINSPSPEQTISVTRGSFTITGAAADPQASRSVGSGIDQVAVYLNGRRDDPHSVFLGNAVLNGTDWSLTFTPANYPWGSVSLYAYARSRISGQESTAVTFINIT